MTKEFWDKRWNEKKTNFNQKEANPFLIKYFKNLSINEGGRIFVPLCGKTIDIDWLLSEKYQILGVEFNEEAVEDLFKRLRLAAEVKRYGSLKCFSAKNIDIFVGDFFELTEELAGPIDAIYDRASFVALPKDLRKRYSSHLIKISSNKPQLLLTYTYDQNLMAGPPYSISSEEVHNHYDRIYEIQKVASNSATGKLRELCKAEENAYLLK